MSCSSASALLPRPSARRDPPGTHSTSPPASWLAYRARMNSRSESRLRYFAVSTFIVSPCTSSAAHADRSARRTTVRETCSSALPGVPPGRMNERSFSQRPRCSGRSPAPAGRCPLLDPQRRELGLLHDRVAQVRADVEQLVLNPRQRGRDLRVQPPERDRHADRASSPRRCPRTRPAAGRSSRSCSCRRAGSSRRRRCACRSW